MKNTITDNIELLEDGLAPTLKRVEEFDFTLKNIYSKKELNLIIKDINELPRYKDSELSTFIDELYKLSHKTHGELIDFIELLKRTPKRNDTEIREELKTLKYLPKTSRKELGALDLHLKNFPKQTKDELNALLDYITLFPLKMEKEVSTITRKIKQFPKLNNTETSNLLKSIEALELSEQTKKGLICLIKRAILIKQLNIAEGLKHIEKEPKEQLLALTEIIKKHIPKCSMIILFGSYARGTEVIYDESIETSGCRTSFQSDFDIMIVLPHPATPTKAFHTEGKICSDIRAEYEKLFERSMYITPPQFVVESESLLYENLEKQRPFFMDVLKDAIFLYNDGRVTLPESKELLYKARKELAEESFKHFSFGNEFLVGGYFYHSRYNYVTASYMLHQACEKYYHDISMVFINYTPKLHDLEKLIERTNIFSQELQTVFPRVTEFEIETFELLCDSYVDSRYNTEFKVTKEELEYIIERTEMLKEIAHRICRERIEYFEILSHSE